MIDESTAQQPPGDQEQQGAGESQPAEERRFTQDEVNRFVAAEKRKRQQLEKQLAELQSKLSQFEEAQKSETEKAIEAAYKRGMQEAEEKWQKELNELKLQTAIERELASRGLHPDLAYVVRHKAELESPDDVPAIVEELTKTHPAFQAALKGNRAPSPTQTAPTNQTGFQAGKQWKRSEIQEIYQQYGGQPPQEYIQEFIKAAKERRVIDDVGL
jgi:hypothetical protein